MITTLASATIADRPNLSAKLLRALWFVVPVLLASELIALETPSAPFLEKNGFYLKSAGFNVKFANDAAGEKAMRALPAHQFVARTVNGQVRYFYAEPKICVCIFVGTRDNYLNYRGILSQPLPPTDNAIADYKTQAGALLADDPTGQDRFDTTDQDYFMEYY